MIQLERVAFMSYAHENDKNDRGYLSRFRDRLEAEVSSLMGEEFTIFQDRKHIRTGQDFEERIKHYLSRSTLLIPIITPHFYNSKWCRKEFEYFREKEQQMPCGPRIVPIYYIDCKPMEDSHQSQPDSMEQLLRKYHYADWRELWRQNYGITTQPATRALRKIAKHIVEMFEDFESQLPIPPHAGPLDLPRSPSDALDTLADSTSDAQDAQDAQFDPTMLPPLSAFRGRSSDIDWVIERLTTRPYIASLDGAEGIGKSSVAAAVVRRLYASFPGGIGVVDCAGLTDPLVVLRRALTPFNPLGRSPDKQDESELAEEAHRLLATRPALIVLDDIDPQLDINRVITPFQYAGVALLLTSKLPLRVPIAMRRTLEPPETPDALDLLTKPLQKSRRGQKSRKRRPPDAEHD